MLCKLFILIILADYIQGFSKYYKKCRLGNLDRDIANFTY